MVTQEELEKMSPEEIKELQKQNCIFCSIISGKIPSKKIYEDDKCIVILDINPANSGHALVIPKEHEAVFPMLPKDLRKHCYMISKQVSQAMLSGFGVKGTSIFVANGALAGQKSPHAMIHVIPREENDGLLSLPKNPITPADLKKLELILRSGVSKLMNIDDPKLQEEIKEFEQGGTKKQTPPTQPAPTPQPQPVQTSTTTSTPIPAQPAPTQNTIPNNSGGSKANLDDIANLFK